ncbi:MAG: DUF2970 domain-containing protein [Pseudomonadota bacterium]
MNKTDGKKAVENTDQQDADKKTGLGPLQILGSVLAAGLGVQSSKNRERDFKQGKAGVFIAAGIVFTLVFIGAVYTVVQIVLANARG